MKKLYGLIMLLGAASACQQHASSTRSVPVAKVTPVATQPAPRLKQPPIANPEKLAATPSTIAESTLNPALSAVLQRHDLSALWQGKYDEDAGQSPAPMDGFFGHDYRRIAFVFTKVSRDNLRPAVYWVKGKNRFQKTVSSFEGTITIKSLTHPKPGITLEDANLLDVENLSDVFTVEAAFEFREQPEASTAGVFTGTAYLDFFIDSEGELHSAMSMLSASLAVPAKGAGVLYTGQWVGYHSEAGKPLQLSGNVFITAPAALAHFSIGDRDPVFNPKYAKLGWNDYWANDEWWANSPKPKLSL